MDIMGWVKKQCNNDDTCIMLSFILVGFLLCVLFNNQTSGLANLAEDDVNVKQQLLTGGPNAESGPKQGSENIGMKPVESRPDLPSSVQIAVGDKGIPSPEPYKMNNEQQVGLSVMDAMIFKPFDEVWSPGFMPVNMVFQGAESTSGVGPSQMGPIDQDRRMPSSTDLDVGSAPTPGGGEAQDEVTISLIYAPWCGHSKRMLPDYEKAKEEFDGKVINGKKVTLNMYNSDDEGGAKKAKEYGVKGFPSLFVEQDGKRTAFPHRGYDEIAEYVNNI